MLFATSSVVFFKAIVAVSGTAVCLLSALFPVEYRNCPVVPYLRFLAFLLAVCLAEFVAIVVRGSKDLDPITLIAPFTFIQALLVQIRILGSNWNRNEKHGNPAWHSFIGTWCLILICDLVSVLGVSQTAPSENTDSVSFVTAGLRLTLFVVFFTPFTRKGTVLLGDVAKQGSALSEANDTTKGHSEPGISNETREAGGRWPCLKGFLIFKSWIIPENSRFTFAVSLVLLGLRTYIVSKQVETMARFNLSLFKAVEEGDLSLVREPMLRHGIVRIAALVVPQCHDIMWMSFKMAREAHGRLKTHGFIMDHDAKFHDTVDTFDISRAAESIPDAVEILDRPMLTLIPSLYHCIRAVWKLSSSSGLPVGMVITLGLAIRSLIHHLFNQYDSFFLEISQHHERKMEKRRKAAIQAWSTIFAHGQIGREKEAYANDLAKDCQLRSTHHSLDVAPKVCSIIVEDICSYAGLFLMVLYTVSTRDPEPVASFPGHAATLTENINILLDLPYETWRSIHPLDRLRRLMMHTSSMKYGEDSLRLPAGRVLFKNVAFKYASEKGKVVFEGLDLVFEPGKTTAIIGSSGTGKSTLIKLIGRYYDPDSGSIAIGGQKLEDLKKGELPKHIAYVEQDPKFFPGNIFDNISYGHPSASMEDVLDASKAVGLHERIMEIPEQYHATMKADARTFSGGERKLLAIARAIVRTPQILVLDEATSSLDPNSEAVVKRCLETRLPDVTKIIITHKLAFTTNADKIYVLTKDEGRVVVGQEGTHGELLERNGIYRDLWKKYIGE